MANNLIQIRRSNTSPTPANTLYGGELAYSYNSNSLFIGAQTGISAAGIKIAGAKFNYLDQATQGTLTANAAQIVDANAFISNTFTSGLFIAPSIASPVANSTAAVITSISPAANTTRLGGSAGGSNTELVTSYAIKTYVDGQISLNGVNTAQAYTFTNVETFNSNVVLGGNATSLIVLGAATINATNYTGTSNNSTNFGGLSLTTVQGQITGNAATAYSNAASYADTKAAAAYTNATAFASNASNINTGTIGVAYLPANLVFWSNNNTFLGTQTFANLTVNGNTVLGDATSDVVKFNAQVNSAIVPSSNNTYDLGSATNYWQNLYANSIRGTTGDFAGNLTVSGNLLVYGNLTTTNVSSIVVSDPIIYLAGNNYSSDAVDIGFAANYSPDGIQELHTGLIRKQSTDNYYLFVGSTQELSGNNQVNTTATGFRSATLYSYLNSGALTTSNTAVSITANSTIAVNITANSITLSSPLAATSGGTGLNSYTAGDMIYASNTTAFAKVSIGTFGTVLQANSSGLPQFATLDGGTF